MPHSDKRFVGYNAEDKALDAETLRKYIFGGHVSEYMENLQARARPGPSFYCICVMDRYRQMWVLCKLQLKRGQKK